MCSALRCLLFVGCVPFVSVFLFAMCDSVVFNVLLWLVCFLVCDLYIYIYMFFFELCCCFVLSDGPLSTICCVLLCFICAAAFVLLLCAARWSYVYYLLVC